MNETTELDETGLRQFLTKLYWECMNSEFTGEVNQQYHSNEDEIYCPKTFDGYLCWSKTRAGQTVSQKCPGFVTGFDGRKDAFKTCLDNGSWFQHPDSGSEWSNYTTCVDMEDLWFRHSVNYLYVAGYSISLTTLVISLLIFSCFRSLHCTRIQIHIQLFLSLAFSSISWIIWYKFVVEKPLMMIEHNVLCIGVHIFNNYLMVTSYFWMFCEGIHLHFVLVVVFVKDGTIMRIFYVIGWVLPLLFTVIYVLLRAFQSPITNDCWLNENPYSWVITVPVTISLLISLCFLINVIRVLLTKLKNTSPVGRHQPPVAIRKAVRATLILFPLFGLQHILLPLRPETGTAFEEYYQIFAAILISGQGFCVSCLFCFLNHEVTNALRIFGHRFWPQYVLPPVWESVNAPLPTQSRDIAV